jgi:predicted MFS family arabinose efflux permease
MNQARNANGIDRRLVVLLAAACGLTVANNYYVQPLLHAISGAFGVGPGAAGLLVTLVQLGYVLGLVFVVPLGDLLDRRRIVPGILVVTALALGVAAAAPNLGILATAIVVVGLTSVVAQMLVPLVATLAGPEHRGELVGSVMTGLMLGTMLSRTFAGLLAQVAGWRSVFAVAALAMVVLAVVLARDLPAVRPPTSLGYGQLLRSVGSLLLHEPVLRRRTLYGAIAFALFNLFWTTLAFLLADPPFHFGEAAIGLFALAAAPAPLAAPRAGRLADRGHTQVLSIACLAVIAVGFGFALAGSASLPPLLAAALLISLGVQSLHVTNQSAIYALGSDKSSRVNSGYMVGYYFGGMAGSAIAATVFAAEGWAGVVLVGFLFVGLGALVWLTEPDHMAIARIKRIMGYAVQVAGLSPETVQEPVNRRK